LGQTLDRDAEAGLVHHHEHGVEAPVRLADDPAPRAVVVHHAGGVAVDAHLVLDRAAGDAVALADRAVRVHMVARHHEERDALHALGCALDPGQHQMNDVLGDVLLAGRDEYLGARDRIGPVAVRDGLGLDQSEIRAAMRLGQVHGAGPTALDHLGQIGALLLVRAVDEERRDGPEREARIHGEGHVGRGRELVHHDAEGIGQPLPAVFLGHRKAHPAALGVGLMGRLEAGRGFHGAVREPLAALLVAHAVEGLEHLLAKLRALSRMAWMVSGVASAKPGRLL
jgi:hypothetical protein